MVETPSRPSARTDGSPAALRARLVLPDFGLTARADGARRTPASTPVRASLFSPARAQALGTPQRLAQILGGSAPLAGSSSAIRTPLTARRGLEETRLSDLMSIDSIGRASAQMRAERKRHRSPSKNGFTPVNWLAGKQSTASQTRIDSRATPPTVSPADSDRQPPRAALVACGGKKPKRLGDLAYAPDSAAPPDEAGGSLNGLRRGDEQGGMSSGLRDIRHQSIICASRRRTSRKVLLVS